MPTYTELMNQAQALMAEAEQIRNQERARIVAELRATMAEHGLTVEDLAERKPTAGKSKLPAKYRGPNGELWAGSPGRRPEWVKTAVAAGKSLDEFLIA